MELPKISEVREMTNAELAVLKGDLQEDYDKASVNLVNATNEWNPLAEIFYVINDRIGQRG